jgi:hypothetical protein
LRVTILDSRIFLWNVDHFAYGLCEEPRNQESKKKINRRGKLLFSATNQRSLRQSVWVTSSILDSPRDDGFNCFYLGLCEEPGNQESKNKITRRGNLPINANNRRSLRRWVWVTSSILDSPRDDGRNFKRVERSEALGI